MKMFLGMPMGRQQAHPYATRAFFRASQGEIQMPIMEMMATSSLLPFSFNQLWLTAKNNDADYFAMIHSDVVPDMGWLDVMYKELLETGADVLSAVIPIKNSSGLTSTALESSDPWSPRRLTLYEIFDREETFFDPLLLVNTGLWICKMKSFWNTKDLIFHQEDSYRETKNGLEPLTLSEDWGFSRQARTNGARLFATRKVKLYHEHVNYHNHFAWGNTETDPLHPTTRVVELNPDESWAETPEVYEEKDPE